MRKRLSGLLLSLILIFQILPVLSFAEENSAPELQEEENTVLNRIQNGDFLYFGEYWNRNIKWKVLDANAMSTGEPGLFLLSANMLRNDGVVFSVEHDTVWLNSDARQWCADMYTGSFSAREIPLIAPTTKKDDGGIYFTQKWEPTELIEDYVFFLSADEAALYIGPNNGDPGLTAKAYDGSVGYWWLRSVQGEKAGLVVSDNTVSSDDLFKPWGARPAINLAAQNAVFVSPGNDKADPGILQVIDETADGEWKLTLADPTRLFDLEEIYLHDGELTVSYKGASVGDNEYISALVCDMDGQLYAYGRLVKPEKAAGEFSVSLSDFVFPDGASLYLFSEQDNGVGKTDYAGELHRVMVTIQLDAGDGIGEMEPITVPLGEAPEITEPEFQPPHGMYFDRWAAEEGLFDSEMHAMQDGTLTALYTPAMAREIGLDKVAAVLPLFESITIQATVLPEDAMDTTVQWIGGDDIAQLTDHGDGSCTIEALSPGNTSIKAVSGDGRAEIEVPITVTGTNSMVTLSDYWMYLAAGVAALILLILFIRFLVKRIRIRRMMREYDE